MKEIAGYNERMFFIAHNNCDVYHIGCVEHGQVTTTGQPFLEFWADETVCVARVAELLAATKVENEYTAQLMAVVDADKVKVLEDGMKKGTL